MRRKLGPTPSKLKSFYYILSDPLKFYLGIFFYKFEKLLELLTT